MEDYAGTEYVEVAEDVVLARRLESTETDLCLMASAFIDFLLSKEDTVRCLHDHLRESVQRRRETIAAVDATQEVL